MKTKEWLLAFVIASLAAPMMAGVPSSIPIQGHLFQNTGEPVSDGVHDVTVRIITDDTGPDGVVVCDACPIEFHDGVFQVVIGRDGMPELPILADPTFVELTVDGEVLSPQIEIHSVPFAHEAAHVVQQAPGRVPVATILPLAGPPSADDADYVVADGRAMSSEEYPELFKSIGQRWGNGGNDEHDSTDFNLPDLRGLFLRGDDMGTGRDQNFLDRTAADGSTVENTGVGTYQYVASQPFRETMGQIHATREANLLSVSHKPVYISHSADEVRGATPNAAVIYVIKVR